MKTAIALTLAVTTTLGLSACGGESKPKAADAVTKMEARMKTYKTVDVTVSGTKNQKAMALNLHGPTTGTSVAGSFTTDGQTSQLIQTNGTLYTKSPASYFSQEGGSAYADMLADKWINQGSSDATNSLSSLMKDLTTKKSSGVFKALSVADTKVTSDKLNGQDAWKLTSKDGKATAWLSKGDFDLLKANGSGFGSDKNDGSTKTVTINKHDEAENITAPAGALDLSQLGK